MTTSHPFGTEITVEQLQQQFSSLHSWEERYRQLILLSRRLPPLSAEYKQPQNEVSGCENRVWLGYELQPDGKMHFYAESEGRIVRGLLAILLTAVEGKSKQEIINSDPLALLEQLGIGAQLSISRLQGLKQIVQRLHQLAQQSE